MLGPEGQRRALSGLVTGGETDVVVLLHDKTPLCHWAVDPGFPVLDNRDAGNPGRGALVATWRVMLPESLVIGNVATRVQVLNRRGSLVIQEDFPTPVSKEEGKCLLVYINHYIGVK